jgi:hypothetical protein
MPDSENIVSSAVGSAELQLARAGGGGSSSASGGGSGHSSSSSRSSSRSSSSGPSRPMTPEESLWTGMIFLLFIAVVVVGAVIARWQAKKMAKKRTELLQALEETGAKEPAVWSTAELQQRIREVFLGFQKAWSDLDAEAMKDLLTDDYYRRAVLEISVLYNQKRLNLMEDVDITRVDFLSFTNAEGESGDQVRVLISARAKDTLKDIAADKILMSDRSDFHEYWTFRRESGLWKLALVEQTTASANFIEQPIADFAGRNGFFYDKDFGWLMMPNKGAIFSRSNFGSSDINNHVIGYYRDKIVEFYTYRPNKEKRENYVVAQAILPRSYRDILVKDRKWFASCPKGLEEHSLESPDFNKKYLVCAHPEDTIGTLELLTPNFMVHVEELAYDMSIEVVDNVLYFYTLDRRCSYDQMLQLLAWAFDEMKM